VSAFQKDIVSYAHAWANIDYEANDKTVIAYFKQPEEVEAQKIELETNGWARKKQRPPVRIPRGIKESLVELFNIRPRISPEQALVKLRAMREHENNLFVAYVMTEARVHSQFSQFMKRRKDLKLDANASIDIAPERRLPVGNCKRYKDLFKMNELRFEIQRRKLNVCVQGKQKHELVQILLTNDKDLHEGHQEEDDIDMAYTAAQNDEDVVDPELETDNDSKEEEDNSTNLDDPEVMAILMEDLQV
jgi:hypothetical protein